MEEGDEELGEILGGLGEVVWPTLTAVSDGGEAHAGRLADEMLADGNRD